MALERQPTYASLICYLDYKIFISQCQVRKSQYFLDFFAKNPVFALLEAFALKYWQPWQASANSRGAVFFRFISLAVRANHRTGRHVPRHVRPHKSRTAPFPSGRGSAGI